MARVLFGNPVLDKNYAKKWKELIDTPFTEWSAYTRGIIDAEGKQLVAVVNPLLRHEYNEFHKLAAATKRLLNKRKVDELEFRQELRGNYRLMLEDEPANEAMVSGDSGGDSTKQASGENSGSVVRKHDDEDVTEGALLRKYLGNGLLYLNGHNVKVLSEGVTFELRNNQVSDIKITLNESNTYDIHYKKIIPSSDGYYTVENVTKDMLKLTLSDLLNRNIPE